LVQLAAKVDSALILDWPDLGVCPRRRPLKLLTWLCDDWSFLSLEAAVVGSVAALAIEPEWFVGDLAAHCRQVLGWVRP